ncbi:unnamed protein product [Psylliodes chrysocephalus]|uniref:Thioredoxin domain-containing protein 17 n=1 Tax=Psylliodes chrysocephalus TaxID=3402493 RepID=A0A9P0CLM7_9CUCU|nr:unnamed protein product [Psylliodes chrysocephala]
MVHKHHIEGYENFVEFFKNFNANGHTVHIYFGGSNKGETWCPDCVRAWPVITEVIEELKASDPESHFVHVEVGDKFLWKDPKCPFRTDPSTKLMTLPTIIRWKKPQRLEGDKCEKKELVQMLFEEDDS